MRSVITSAFLFAVIATIVPSIIASPIPSPSPGDHVEVPVSIFIYVILVVSVLCSDLWTNQPRPQTPPGPAILITPPDHPIPGSSELAVTGLAHVCIHQDNNEKISSYLFHIRILNTCTYHNKDHHHLLRDLTATNSGRW
jgi:hypothetical protein